MYDIIVIGGGPAGCTAALFAQRYGLKTLVLMDPMSLAQSEEATHVDDWPGTKDISGFDLTNSFRVHAKRYGAEFKMEKAVEIKKDNGFSVKTESSSYESKTIIFATGAKHRKAMVKGEEEFAGKGVSYCASCDGPLFKGKNVLVIGGGDTAINSAILLQSQGVNVALVHKRDELRASRANQDKLSATKAQIIWDTILTEIMGDKMADTVMLKNVKTGESKKMKIDGIFISIGSVPTSELAGQIEVEMNEAGFIETDIEQKTNVPGVFAAGDCTDRLAKKIVVASGYGAVAATSAYNFIKG